jgi:transcriptional regulator with XRE-family HTH domain
MIRIHPLRRWRFENQRTLTSLAEEIGTSAGALSNMETWRHQPVINRVYALVKITGLRFEDFLVEEAGA